METLNESSLMFEDDGIAERFLDHYSHVRGLIRSELVRRHLGSIIDPDRRQRIVDVGCGDAREAVWLASQGHSVVALDPSERMLSRAKAALASANLADQVQLLRGDATTALAQFGEGSFDLVLSHGVLMYQREPASFVAQHVALSRRNGYLSLLTKNGSALAYRATNDGRIEEALRLLDDNQSVGHLGLDTAAHSIDELADFLAAAGSTVTSWAGIRIFSDSRTIDIDAADPSSLIELEWRACQEDPYRSTAALVHVIALNGIDLTEVRKYS